MAKDPLAQLNPTAAARLASSAAAASAAVADDEDNNMGLATSSFAFGPSPSKPAATEPKVRRCRAHSSVAAARWMVAGRIVNGCMRYMNTELDQSAAVCKVSLDNGISAQRSRSPSKPMDFETARPQPLAQARAINHPLQVSSRDATFPCDANAHVPLPVALMSISARAQSAGAAHSSATLARFTKSLSALEHDLQVLVDTMYIRGDAFRCEPLLRCTGVQLCLVAAAAVPSLHGTHAAAEGASEWRCRAARRRQADVHATGLHPEGLHDAGVAR